MPEPSTNKLKFENYAAKWRSPFVIYLDLESLIISISTENNPSISGTVATEKREPCSYCLIVIERENPEPVHFDVYTGPDCMTRLLTKLEKLARFFYYQKRKFSDFIGSAPLKNDFSCLWITIISQDSSLGMLITRVT